eukprot:m.227043 g.227043  ORF g.227043 m.227043 type:complete len:218 (+) comp15970_c0_seq2:88-741(+)
MEYDAVIVPGGGLTKDGQPNSFVEARLDSAAQFKGKCKYFILLSRGTPHKPPPTDGTGQPIDEASASAAYLHKKHSIPENQMLLDTWSLDTIGNAYFAAAMLCAPLSLKKLMVVTSEFHIARTKCIFNWVFPLFIEQVSIAFQNSPNTGLDTENLEGRRTKEAASSRTVIAHSEKYKTKDAFVRFLFTEHGAYRVDTTGVAIQERKAEVPTSVASTY